MPATPLAQVVRHCLAGLPGVALRGLMAIPEATDDVAALRDRVQRFCLRGLGVAPAMIDDVLNNNR